jgi:hypothetical protein
LFLFELPFPLVGLFLFLKVLLFFLFFQKGIGFEDLFHFFRVLFGLESNLLGMSLFLFLKLYSAFLDFLLARFELLGEFI